MTVRTGAATLGGRLMLRHVGMSRSAEAAPRPHADLQPERSVAPSSRHARPGPPPTGAGARAWPRRLPRLLSRAAEAVFVAARRVCLPPDAWIHAMRLVRLLSPGDCGGGGGSGMAEPARSEHKPRAVCRCSGKVRRRGRGDRGSCWVLAAGFTMADTSLTPATSPPRRMAGRVTGGTAMSPRPCRVSSVDPMSPVPTKTHGVG